MLAEPPMLVVPRLQVPALLPQLVSERESIMEFPPALISPRTTRAAGGSRGRILYTVVVIRCLALGSGPTLVGVQPVATTLRSLAVAPLVTDTTKTPSWAPLSMTGTAVVPL